MIEQCSSPGISLSIGEPVISVLPRILEQHKVDPLRLLVASGPGPTRLFASQLVSTNGVCSGAPRHEVKTNDLSSVDELGSFCARQGIETLIALGGGRVIDVCKFASRHRALSVIAIPTALSSDCVASPVAVICINGISHSLPAKIPAAVIIDTELIGRSPLRTTLAGVGDLLSNLSAILDWQLAVEVEGETWDEYASK
jgi:glycerol-1-phosphate dehydrogenase [NAD(P)+]